MNESLRDLLMFIIRNLRVLLQLHLCRILKAEKESRWDIPAPA